MYERTPVSLTQIVSSELSKFSREEPENSRHSFSLHSQETADTRNSKQICEKEREFILIINYKFIEVSNSDTKRN